MSQLDTMSSRRPLLQYQLSKNKTTKASMIRSEHTGTRQILEPNWQVIEIIQLKPESFGKRPMKSIATLSP